jgi:transcriptional regulator with XRE-family HTH domain
MSALSRLINQRRAERGIDSGRELARLTEAPARRQGVKPVTSANASTYISGSHGRPSDRTLKLLAEALSLPLWKLREAADVPPGESEPYQPPPEADRLNRRQRNAVNTIIRLLASREPSPEGSHQLGPGTEPSLGWQSDDHTEVAPPDRSSSATTDSIDDASSESQGNGAK